MQIEIMEAGKVKFEPITLTITFETKDEIADLWHRLNLDHHEFRDEAVEELFDFPKTEAIAPLFWELDKICDANNYWKKD